MRRLLSLDDWGMQLGQLQSALDPESGERFTVKRYFSEKVETEEGWRHRRIELRPDNPDY